jgi:hypothetical protein
MTNFLDAISGSRLGTEHEAFLSLTESLDVAIAAARALARHRPDQARHWETVAEAWEVAKGAIFRLEMERVGGRQ